MLAAISEAAVILRVFGGEWKEKIFPFSGMAVYFRESVVGILADGVEKGREFGGLIFVNND